MKVSYTLRDDSLNLGEVTTDGITDYKQNGTSFTFYTGDHVVLQLNLKQSIIRIDGVPVLAQPQAEHGSQR